jgi:hypothetical protein
MAEIKFLVAEDGTLQICQNGKVIAKVPYADWMALLGDYRV